MSFIKPCYILIETETNESFYSSSHASSSTNGREASANCTERVKWSAGMQWVLLERMVSKLSIKEKCLTHHYVRFQPILAIFLF